MSPGVATVTDGSRLSHATAPSLCTGSPAELSHPYVTVAATGTGGIHAAVALRRSAPGRAVRVGRANLGPNSPQGVAGVPDQHRRVGRRAAGRRALLRR